MSSLPTSAEKMFITRVVTFNQVPREAWASPEIAPDGARKCVLVVDVSQSMWAHMNELVMLIAGFVKDTNIDKKTAEEFNLPSPSGGTALIGCVQWLVGNGLDRDTTVMLISDGVDNFFKGCVPIAEGKEPGTVIQSGPLDFAHAERNFENVALQKQHNAALVQYMVYTGITFVMLGIGDRVKNMLSSMVNQRNIYVAHIDHKCDVRSVLSVIKTLKRTAGKKQKQVFLIDNLQNNLPMHDDDSTQEAQQLKDLMGNIKMGGMVHVVKDLHTVEALEMEIKRVIALIFNTKGLLVLQPFEMGVRWHLLLLLGFMCDSPSPAVIISGKNGKNHIMNYPAGSKDVAPKLYPLLFNSVCSALASTNDSNRDALLPLVLKKEAGVPVGGVNVEYKGKTLTFSATSAQYSCSYSKEVVMKLMNNAEFCSPLDQEPLVCKSPAKKQKK